VYDKALYPSPLSWPGYVSKSSQVIGSDRLPLAIFKIRIIFSSGLRKEYGYSVIVSEYLQMKTARNLFGKGSENKAKVV